MPVPRQKLLTMAQQNYEDKAVCIGVGSGGARGRLAPPSFKLGGIAPPTLPTVYVMNFIAVL